MKHSELVQIAAKWMRGKYLIVITEMASGAGEEADVIGFNGYNSTLIECKASIMDFNTDKYKSYRRYPESGMGSQRYYFTIGKLLHPQNLPEGWGLLELHGKRVYNIRNSVNFKKDYRKELSLLTSAIRRIGKTAPKGISVRCYPYKTKNRASIHIDI
ncbi:MAG: MmcB family DNA repair protein [Nanoarchaeota archaeon]|nr:MmcB family DNA repair protein [Nanoarchaeota archaeon]